MDEGETEEEATVGTDEIVPAQDSTTALAVIDQRQVALLEADEILAVRAGDDEIYVPLRGLCANLGIEPTGQVRRIRADEALAEGLRRDATSIVNPSGGRRGPTREARLANGYV